MKNKTLSSLYTKTRKGMQYKDSFWFNRKEEINSTTIDCILEHELPNGKFYTHHFRIEEWREEDAGELGVKLNFLIQNAIDVTENNMKAEKANGEALEGDVI